MGTLWTAEKISEYHRFMASFISGYTNKIDCADLALEGLVEFAFQQGLPIKLKYFQKGKAQYYTSPTYETLDESSNRALHDAAAQGVAARGIAVAAIVTRNVKKKEEFKKLLRINLGAENVIDNTRRIEPSEARPGDFLMMKRPADMGHTRVIHTITPAFNPKTQKMDYFVIWYQGTYPPEVPSKQAAFLSDLVGSVEKSSGAPLVHEGKPRAWKFDAFEE